MRFPMLASAPLVLCGSLVYAQTPDTPATDASDSPTIVVVGQGQTRQTQTLSSDDMALEVAGTSPIKLIASLRHPIDRAYSAFWMHLSRGRIPADTDFRTFFYQGSYGLRKRGYYFVQLSRYLEDFPRENLLVLVYEEIRSDGEKAVRDCLGFLGVDTQFVSDTLVARVNKGVDLSVLHHQVWGLREAVRSLPQCVEKPLVSIGRRAFVWVPKRRRYEPLDKGLRQEMMSEFMADVRQLEDFLGRDLSIWYAPSQA